MRQSAIVAPERSPRLMSFPSDAFAAFAILPDAMLLLRYTPPLRPPSSVTRQPSRRRI